MGFPLPRLMTPVSIDAQTEFSTLHLGETLDPTSMEISINGGPPCPP